MQAGEGINANARGSVEGNRINNRSVAGQEKARDGLHWQVEMERLMGERG